MGSLISSFRRRRLNSRLSHEREYLHALMASKEQYGPNTWVTAALANQQKVVSSLEAREARL
jgi:hypothetical protein